MASGTAKYKYETDNGNFFFARTDDSPALANIRGTLPTGATTESITFKKAHNYAFRAFFVKPFNKSFRLRQIQFHKQ